MAGPATAILLALTAALSGTAAVAADTETGRNRAAVTDYARLLMIEHKPSEAFARYFAPFLMQHDPEIADGGAGDADFLEKRRAAAPKKYAPVERYVTVIHTILADGDLVAINSHMFTSPADPGREFVDIWRMKDGRFAEHWDVIETIGAPRAKRARKGCSTAVSYAAGSLAGDTAARPACGALDLAADREASRRVVLAQLKAHPSAGGRSLIGRVIADGDMVLVHRRVITPRDPRGTAHADLYRVSNGRIAAHWDVVQPIPDSSVSGRSMVTGPLEPGRRKGQPPQGEKR